MKKIVVFEFDYSGPWGESMSKEMEGLAKDIANEPGFLWKIWIENEKNNKSGGVYMFENESFANDYIQKHSKRLKGFGIDNITYSMYDINEKLSVIDNCINSVL